MNNFDKIKAMTVDEIAEFLDTTTACHRCMYRKDKKNCRRYSC